MFQDAHSFLRFGGMMSFFWYLLSLPLIHTVQHKFIHPSPFAEACLLVSSSILRSAREEPPWDAEPRIELGPALQQAVALPTELRRILTELRHILIELRRILIELRRILIELRHILTELRRIGCGPQFFGCLFRWLKLSLYHKPYISQQNVRLSYLSLILCSLCVPRIACVFYRCCYIMMDSASTALLNGAFKNWCISK